MNHLDLFSGIGGFSLALERVGFTTVGFCEVDPYCRLLLQKHWKGVTIHHDIKKLEAKDIKEPIDILTGGFPCQPYSVAGKQKGTNDDRYLWPDMFRVIKEVRPTWIIAENVRGIINIQDGMVFETVCTDLESEGFEVQAFIIPAAGVGAPHRRERVWIVGYSKHNGSLTSKIRRRNQEADARSKEGKISSIEPERTSGSSDNEVMENTRRTLRQGSEFEGKNANESEQENADQFKRSSSTSEHNVANSKGVHVQGQQDRSWQGESRGESWWRTEPDVGRVANGVPGRVYRLKGLGNSIVPQIAEEIGRAIWNVTKNQV
jgi:DNA (cytosine-5)-methyltransferase 1|tara:strand:+ start:1245 stop:2201 length:957 start_codon:yes stop_codon:yes gene_type:complete